MEAHKIISFFQDQQGAFVQLLTRLVLIPSHTGDDKAINRFLGELEKLFAIFHPCLERIRGEKGDLLRLTLMPDKLESLVLLAHADTVKVKSQMKPGLVSEGRLYGNGAYDMKAGIALFFFVLKALDHFGIIPKRRLEILVNPDEESGSSFSKGHLLALCRGARAVLLPEPCCTNGGVKVRRKAIARLQARLQGLASHSGLAPELGRDANRALANLLAEIDARVHEYDQMTFNPGLIRGGTAVNIVAPESFLYGEIRSFSNGDLQDILDKIGVISEIDGVLIRWQNQVQHPALETTAANQLLYLRAKEIMDAVSYPMPECSSGGSSDGSTLSAAGIPVLDGIGMKGANAHAADEYVEIADFPFRAYLFFRLIREIV